MGKNNKKKTIITKIAKVIKEKNLLVKFVCLFMAFALWIYVSNVENPIKQYTITNVPVQIINSDILKEDNLAIAPDQNFTVSLTIQGASTNIYSVNKSQFTVVANLSNATLKAGDNIIPVDVIDSPNNVNIKDNGILRINVKLENIIEKTMKVQSELNISTENNNYVKDISFSTPNITISGPQDSVNKVSKLVVRGDLTAKEGAETTVNFPVEAVDSNGNIVNDVTLSTSDVQATITTEKGKSVPIKVQTTGTLKEGLTLSSVTVNPNTIKILGEQNLLDSINEIMSKPIDLSSITQNETIITGVVLPQNISLLPNENEIEVEVKVVGSNDTNSSGKQLKDNVYTTRTFQLPINIIGSLQGYTAKLSKDTVMVVLSGTQEQLNSIEPLDLSCSVDISQMSSLGGEVAPTIKISNVSGISIKSQTPQKVNVVFDKTSN